MIISEAVKQNPAEVLTAAGFPNPHRRQDQAAPTPTGLPVALGPSSAQEPQEGRKAKASQARAPGPEARRQEQPKAALQPAEQLQAGEDQVLSEQVLRQKAKLAELQATAGESAAIRKDWQENEEGEEEEEDPQEAIARLLERVTPCANAYPVSLVQSTERQRIQSMGDKWTYLNGLRIMVKPANADDCIFLVANCMLTPETDMEESSWGIHRGASRITPKFTTHSRQRNWSHSVCMPYLDQPEKRAEQDYQVAANCGGTHSRFVVSPEKQRKHFFAITVPAYQAVWVEDDEKQSVEPGLWRDVDGFYGVVTTLPGDRILAVCSIRYAAHWASEMNRGRFTLVRDDLGLDGLHDRGLQSVRALSPGLHRVALMAAVDAPPPGPHIYRARAALTVGNETGVSNALQGDRQLTLIRLPSSIVVGPNRVLEPVTVDEGRWTEIPGLEVTVALRRPRDRVMVVYHTDCNPQSHFYEAHFTLFRRSESGSPKNLGFSEEFGTEMVSSDYGASSEYPVGIMCDAPGGLGTYTYYLCARVNNTGTSTENPAVTVGYSGSITAVLLSSR